MLQQFPEPGWHWHCILFLLIMHSSSSLYILLYHWRPEMRLARVRTMNPRTRRTNVAVRVVFWSPRSGNRTSARAANDNHQTDPRGSLHRFITACRSTRHIRPSHVRILYLSRHSPTVDELAIYGHIIPGLICLNNWTINK